MTKRPQFKTTTAMASLVTLPAVGLTIALILAPVQAQAQTAPSQADAATMTIEEIVVTAQRREENQQDVPIAVTALDSQFLLDTDAQTLQDLNGAVPGFVSTRTVGYSAAPLTIRGIGGANGGGNTFNDEPVGVYVDGIYISRLSFSTADLVDIETIQVLRGPQGTLYGRNSTAGAVLIRSARPTFETEGYVRAEATTLEEFRVEGALSGPLIGDSLAGRVAAGYSDFDGFGTNVATGEEAGGSEDITLRGSLTFEPGAAFRATLIADYLSRDADVATIAVADPTQGATSPFDERDDFDQLLEDNRFALNSPSFTDTELWGIMLDARYDFGPVVLESLTGYRELHTDGAQDSDSTAMTLFNNTGDIDDLQFSQEFHLTSDHGGPLSWIAGVFYLHNEASQFFVINNFNALFGLGTNATFDAEQDLDTVAVFADATYEITPALSLTFGGRFSYEEKRFSNDLQVLTIQAGFFPPAGTTLPAGSPFSDPPLFEDSEEFDDFSIRAVLDYRITEDVLAYFSYSQGFKSGGFNSFGLETAFDEEDIDAFELGLKTDWYGGRLRANATGFYYDYSNLQLRLPVPTGGVSIDNVGESEIAGLELELTARPVDGLRLTANVSYLHTEITEGTLPAVPADAVFPIGAPVPLEDVDVSGNELTRAPEWQVFLDGRYEFDFFGLGLGFAGGNLRYQSRVFFLETNQDQSTFRNDSWVEIGLRAGWESFDGRWRFTVFGENVNDNRHVTQVTALGSFPNASINLPAKAGFRLEARY